MHAVDDEAAALAGVIGERVRSKRQTRGWTLDRLAEVAGVSRRALVNVEQGAANPSVGTLLRLADALGVGLPALVEPPSRDGVKVTRKGEAAPLWSGPGGGRGVLVSGTEPPDVVELWDWTLAAGDEHATEAHAKGTRELVHVLQGRLALTVAGETVTLAAGDAASFSGDVPHGYRNASTRSTRFSLAVFEPGVGAPSRDGARPTPAKTTRHHDGG